MTKIIDFIKKKFLTKKFLTFGIIGVINTVIAMGVYWIFFSKVTVENAFWSNTVSFIVASTFSYFANALLTFKPKNKSTMQFSIVMLVFLSRLLVSNGLTTLFNDIIQTGFHVDYSVHKFATIIAPFIGSALLIPIAYFALEYVFKKTDIKKTENL